MTALIINIILVVLFIGAILYIFTKTNQYNSLDADYSDLLEKYYKICKEVDVLRRENKMISQENANLNQAPKTEKINKSKKTTTRKTTKK